MAILQLLALVVIFAAVGWLAFVAKVCLVRPESARAGLAAMGSTPAIQFGEHALRGLAGLAMVLRAEVSKAPLAFEAIGWFVVATSLLIVLLPRRWHHAYAVFWADRIPGWAFRIASIPTMIGAVLLGFAAL